MWSSLVLRVCDAGSVSSWNYYFCYATANHSFSVTNSGLSLLSFLRDQHTLICFSAYSWELALFNEGHWVWTLTCCSKSGDRTGFRKAVYICIQIVNTSMKKCTYHLKGNVKNAHFSVRVNSHLHVKIKKKNSLASSQFLNVVTSFICTCARNRRLCNREPGLL